MNRHLQAVASIALAFGLSVSAQAQSLPDFTGLSSLVDIEFSYWLTKEVGVTPVPGSSFYREKEMCRNFVRFAFCKTEELLKQAGERLATVKSRVG